MRPIHHTVATLFALGVGPVSALAQFSFTDLRSQLYGYDLVGISPDGGTLVGRSPGGEGFGLPVYYRAGQVTTLPILTYGNGIARSMASDGTIVGGVLRGHEQGTDDAGVWRNDQISLLEHEPGGFTTDATAISADGHVIVGGSTAASHLALRPSRWVDGHVESLGDLPGNFEGGEAFAVNSDGSIVVGSAAGYSRAFRWQNGTIEALPLIDPHSDVVTSRAVDVSADGRRIIGEQNHSGGVFTDGLLWQDGTPTLIPDLPGGTAVYPHGISADGSLVVGLSSAGAGRAFIWDDLNGTRDLTQLLIDAGVDLHGWNRLFDVVDISADGRTLLGYGYNAFGEYAPFVATIPEPGTLSLAAVSFVLFGLRRGRER